jgi:hypothetical protein
MSSGVILAVFSREGKEPTTLETPLASKDLPSFLSALEVTQQKCNEFLTAEMALYKAPSSAPAPKKAKGPPKKRRKLKAPESSEPVDGAS